MQDTEQQPVWAASGEEALTRLDATPHGLTEAEARQRLERHGPNRLREKPPRPAWMKFLDQIDLLAQIGVAILLFVVGLKHGLQHIRHIGPGALGGTLWQDLPTQLGQRLDHNDPIRWRGDGFVLGVQWHPEFHPPLDSRLLPREPLIEALLTAAAARAAESG